MSPHEVSLVTQKSSTKKLAKKTIPEYLTVLSLSLAKKFMQLFQGLLKSIETAKSMEIVAKILFINILQAKISEFQLQDTTPGVGSDPAAQYLTGG
jgi:hypothetical protein